MADTATLNYVSPSQINFEIPAGISVGAAAMTIGTQTVEVQYRTRPRRDYSRLNSDGLAAAYVVRVGPGNVQTVEAFFTIQGGSPVAVPISLSPSTDQFYLILYGTGIRGAAGNVSVAIQGINAPVTYAGPQAIPGLDQVNVLLPPQLAGRGTVNIVNSSAR